MNFLPNPYGISSVGLENFLPENVSVASIIIPDLIKLKECAKKAGFNLHIESAYRSFDKQLSIWNRKASGELPLLDKTGKKINTPIADPETLMQTILFWSLLPGCSRHHFGTDIDVVDANSIPENYEVQLTPEECNTLFSKFHSWLSDTIESNRSFGFSRVFIHSKGLVQEELWHLSHLPTAKKIQEKFSETELTQILEKSSLACKEVVLSHLDFILDNYVYPYFI